MLRRYLIIGLLVVGSAFYLSLVYKNGVRLVANGQSLWAVVAGVLVCFAGGGLAGYLMRTVPADQSRTTTGGRAAAGAVLAVTLAVVGGLVGHYVDSLLSLDNIAPGGLICLGVALAFRAVAIVNSRFPLRSQTD